MELLINPKQDKITKNEVEKVEFKQSEYTLLGVFLRTRGLKLYGYNHIEDTIFEVEISYKNTIYTQVMNNKLVPNEKETEKCSIDSKFVYFEALNYKTAVNRVDKFKKGIIKDLCNLRKPVKNELKLF